jgi:hypothetical protein
MRSREIGGGDVGWEVMDDGKGGGKVGGWGRSSLALDVSGRRRGE